MCENDYIHVNFNEKQLVQEAEYEIPCHWLLTRCIRERYDSISNKIAATIKIYKSEGNIIEIGCGDGKNLYDMYKRLGNNYCYTGLDYSARAIMFAKAFTLNTGIEFIQNYSTAMSTILKKKYDVVILRDFMEHLDEKELDETIINIKAIANKDCYLVFVVPTINDPVTQKHYRHYTSRMITDYLTKHGITTKLIFGFIYQPYWIGFFLRNLFRFPIIWRIYRYFVKEVGDKNAKMLIGIAAIS
jgi:2-polyprenyl-3-methyl-5-hydroxy-6-metoxy-1,4-benzoquinol methylase